MQGFNGILGCYRNGPHTTQPRRNNTASEAGVQGEREQHLLSLLSKQDGLSARLCIFKRWPRPSSGKKRWQHSGWGRRRTGSGETPAPPATSTPHQFLALFPHSLNEGLSSFRTSAKYNDSPKILPLDLITRSSENGQGGCWWGLKQERIKATENGGAHASESFTDDLSPRPQEKNYINPREILWSFLQENFKLQDYHISSSEKTQWVDHRAHIQVLRASCL